jgi:membrane protein
MQQLSRFRLWLADVRHVPWLPALLTLRERFREDRLGLTASSLTFTTTIALVPLLTVALAVLTAFPMFAKFQDVLQKWLVASLIPDDIARQVLGYLGQFSRKASKLGAFGLGALVLTSLALIFTIDRTLNSIWRVRTLRPITQRLLIYWSALTLGPLILGVSISFSSYAISASRGLVEGLPGGVGFLLDTTQFLMVAGGMSAMFHYLPNTRVRWGHAWMGGLFVATGLEIAKRLLAWYLEMVPLYSAVYGAFATLPILLVWIYLSWVIVLLGAALTAYVPGLIAGLPPPRNGVGARFALALSVLGTLGASRTEPSRGQTSAQLSQVLHVDPLELAEVLDALKAMDWIGKLQESAGSDGGARWVLLVDPVQTPVAPLVQNLLLAQEVQTSAFWRVALRPTCMLHEVI